MFAELQRLDTDLFLKISQTFASEPALKVVAQFFAHDAIYILFVLAFLIVVAKYTNFDKTVSSSISQHQAETFIGGLAIFFAGGAAWCVNNLFSLFYFRPRPFVTLLTQPLVDADALSKSFPSDHAGVSFAIAFALMRFNPRYTWLGLTLAALIAFGRVAAGVHYPTDIIAGAVVGLLVGDFVWRQFSQPKILSSLNSIWPKPSSQPPASSV